MFLSSLSLSLTWICALLILVTYLAHTLAKKRSLKLPPGPKGLPFLGNLPMLSYKLPHRELYCLSRKHGPVMHLRVGFVPIIVVSSPQSAELFLKTYDSIFASRPSSEAGKYMGYELKGLAFAEYGPYWKNLRRLCNLELLSNLKIESFKSMRREETDSFIESLKKASRDGVEVDVSAKVKALITDMSFRMIFGSKYMQSDDQTRFIELFKEQDRLAAQFNIADYFPYIGALDIQGLAKRMKAASRVFDELLEKIIEEHLIFRADGSRIPDFVDFLLSYMESKENEFRIDGSHVKATLVDMLAGSVDTSSTAIDWAFSELLKHPDVMKKVQEEVDRVVGLDRMVEESDLVQLEYLDMVIKESFRLHPVVPLLIPHQSTKECTINGYHIPQKSRIIINTWAIGRDPEVWDDAEEFRPERFAGNNIDYTGRQFQFLPFGSGRRSCPGLQLGLKVVRLVLAQLVHCFDWELSNGRLCNEINMDEEFGTAMLRATHLSLIPIYRLPNEHHIGC